MVSGVVATPAHAVLIDFSSGSTFGPGGYGNPTGYTEDNMTVQSVYGADEHIHLITGGPSGTFIENHSGCCSSPYVITFDVLVNIISLDWNLGGTNSFLTNAVDAVSHTLPDFGGWNTFVPASSSMPPEDFLGITEIIWTQSDGRLQIDNLVYEVVGPAPIPEPSTMLLLGTGLAGIVAWRARKQHA